jgi:trans-aconitate methyltransferase
MTTDQTGQRWDAADYAGNAGFVPDLGSIVLGWLDPKPGERILDLGCGDGALTARLVAAGAAVIGVDSSEALLREARGRGLDVRLMDAQALDFDAAFDAVFSNAALHWMPRAEAVLGGVARGLVPGGRFVAEFGGHGNVAAIVTALRAVAKMQALDPGLAAGWFYPTAEEYRALLEARGFTVERIELVPRPTPLPTGLRGWLRTFRRPYLDAMPAEQREAVLDELESLLAPALRDQSGRWTADYVRLRVSAVRGAPSERSVRT